MWFAIAAIFGSTVALATTNVDITVRVDDYGLTALDAVLIEGGDGSLGVTAPAGAAGAGRTVDILDSAGVMLDQVSVPLVDPRHRSLIRPEGGGEQVTLPWAITTVRVPWPPGADHLIVDGQVVLPLDARPKWRDGESARPVAVTGDSGERLDLVVLADGYLAEEEGDFDADVQTIVQHLLDLDPYSRYAGFLNIWKHFTPSDQSGLTGLSGPHDDTAMGCYYGCFDTARLICCDDAVVATTANDAVPGADGILVLVNDAKYGGSGSSAYATSYVGAEFIDVASHELGHTLVALWDEYTYPGTTGTIDFAPNCTSDADNPHWDHWLIDDAIDTFQGCSYTDAFRPTANSCLMRTLGHPDYCAVCREWIVHSLYAQLPSRLIANATPEPGAEIRLRNGDSQEFIIDILGPDDVILRWSVEGEILDETTAGGDPFILDGCAGVNGDLVLTAFDPTDWVRDDPYGHTWHDVSWPVKTQKCGACGCATPPSPGRSPPSPVEGAVFALTLLLVAGRRR